MLLLLSCMSFFYTLDISPLSDIQFTDFLSFYRLSFHLVDFFLSCIWPCFSFWSGLAEPDAGKRNKEQVALCY